MLQRRRQQRQRKDKTRRASKTRSTTRESGTQDEVRQFNTSRKKAHELEKGRNEFEFEFRFFDQ
jgi:hypothetical protein